MKKTGRHTLFRHDRFQQMFGAADVNGDGVISFHEAVDFVNKFMVK